MAGAARTAPNPCLRYPKALPDARRCAAQGLVDAYNRLQARCATREVDEDELFQLALLCVAEESTVSLEELQQTLADFAVAVEETPDAGAIDAGLVAFAERDFQRTVSIATGSIATGSIARALPRDSEERRKVLRLRGQCLFASEDYDGAVEVFRAALRLTPRAEAPEAWADLQFRIGEAAAISREPSGLLAAEQAFELALEVLDQDQWTSRRAMALNGLATCQSELLKSGFHGEVGNSAPMARLEEMIEAYGAAAEVFYSLSEWRC